jgi:hypothetical protein
MSGIKAVFFRKSVPYMVVNNKQKILGRTRNAYFLKMLPYTEASRTYKLINVKFRRDNSVGIATGYGLDGRG